MTVATNLLKSFVSRIERIESEIKDLNTDKSDIYKEARAAGFDVKALKAVIAIRRKDPNEVEEHNATVDLYLANLNGTDRATRACERDHTPNSTTAAALEAAKRGEVHAIPNDLSIPECLRREPAEAV